MPVFQGSLAALLHRPPPQSITSLAPTLGPSPATDCPKPGSSCRGLTRKGSVPISVSFCLYLWAILGRLVVASPTKLVSLSHANATKTPKLAGLPVWDSLGLALATTLSQSSKSTRSWM